MAAIKSVARSATVAFAPTAPDIVALGTMSGAIDASFSASASLDVFKIDFSRPDPDLDLLASVSSNEKFNRLSWGAAGAAGEAHPYGLLAGGLADGTVCVWNPAPFIRQENNETSLLSKMQKHTGRVRGLEFNVITPNLLASGGDDGDIFIWDLVDPTSPSHFPALRGGGQENIVDLSWNRKVQNIMATTSNSGVSVVWDLRRQRSILSFSDPNNRRACAALEWNPDGATQLIVASADDRFPSLQVWDLRNSISPVKELLGHTKGVVTMAWCPVDSGLLLSSGKDYRTFCWDTISGEVVCELPASSNWNFDVQWSPRIAGVLSTSSYDGRVNLYNIEACSRTLPSEGHFGGSIGSLATMRAPKWLKRPAGVCFGFDGKLASFGLKNGPISEVKIESLITEEELINRSKEFEAVIKDPGSKHPLRDLCVKKAEESGSEDEKELWSFLKIMFEENARSALLNHLGFSLPEVKENKLEEISGETEDLNAQMSKFTLSNGTSETIEEKSSSLAPSDFLVQQTDTVDDGADFFNNLSTPKAALSPKVLTSIEEVNTEATNTHGEAHDDGLDDEDEDDRAVHHALTVGNFKDAVKQCLLANRMADALVLAHVGGSALWDETLKEYLRKHRRPYRKVLAAVVTHDIGNLINNRPLNDWKGTLALLCSYAGSEDWTILCNSLAARLDVAGYTQAALLCYICAANLDELARLWYREVLLKCNSASFVKELQELMEKVIVLALAKGEKRTTPSLDRLVRNYTELLVSQGLNTAAMDYLDLIPLEESPEELIMLREHISRSKKGGQNATVSNSVTPSVWTISNHVAGFQASLGNAQELIYPDSTQEPAYGARQEPPYMQPDTYSQPQVFYPSQPAVPHWSQPPPMAQQVPYAPRPVTTFNPVDTPIVPTPPAPNHSVTSGLVVPPAQFPTGSYMFSAPRQIGPRDWGNPSLHSTPRPPPPKHSGPRDWENITWAPGEPGYSGSHSTTNMMFPGQANQPVSTAPAPHGFMPVSAPRAPLVQQQPGRLTPPVQPQSPRSSSPTAPSIAPMPDAPVTIYTVDTSELPDDLKPVVATLSRIFDETKELSGSEVMRYQKQREIDDGSRRLGKFFAKLNKADISPTVRGKLIQICQSIDAEDYATVLQVQMMDLVSNHWDECGLWLSSFRRMVRIKLQDQEKQKGAKS